MEDRIDIGIDGGGTGCRVVVRHGAAEARATAGPANVASDAAAAEAAIRLALGSALHDLGLHADDLARARIVAGMAGCRLPGAADAFAMRLPFLAYVVDDSVTALQGALGGQDGSLVSLGTGSFFIRKAGEKITHHGGWGFHLGDEGSAAWLGRRALKLALKASDGRVPDDPLYGLLFERLKSHPARWARTARPEDYAALAQVITGAGTPASTSLLKDCASVVATALSLLDHPRDQPWVLGGGLAPFVLPHLPGGIAATRVEPKGQPLDGALAMARALP